MKIFLAGENGKKRLIRKLADVNIFSGGETRHWLHDPLLESEKENATVSGGRVLQKYGKRCQADCMGGTPSKDMNIYLAGQVKSFQGKQEHTNAVKDHRPYILESFYYADETTEKLIPFFGDFLLDSGAFTFMQSSKSHVNWDEYIERYASFINRNNIEKFFELDIDSVVGYDKVLKYRKCLEKLTNKSVIPVWHKSRGIDEYKRMCDEYDYVAIGGIVAKEIKPEQYGAFPMMIAEAHRRKAKIHGLGFTSLEWLPKCRFDSVDSTAWTTGNRFGFIYQFNGKTMVKHDCPKGKRLADSKRVAEINYLEWIKFQKYAEKNL
jgi:hypothetical protein